MANVIKDCEGQVMHPQDRVIIETEDGRVFQLGPQQPFQKGTQLTECGLKARSDRITYCTTCQRPCRRAS
ncbi:MAG TPA: hypothetical protein VEW42_02500 [Candidatus Eisenbacteria bacterium]|nr:hypothetical protein [Candidatus Eisenbacteria bacterium]